MNKLYLIIITDALNVNIDDIKAIFGYQKSVPISNIDLYDAGLIFGWCIGRYRDRILISVKNLTFEFFNENISEHEQKLCDLFPNSEILILNLYSVIDGYGYSIIHNGKRERIKWGSHEAVYYEFGTKIIEEALVDETDTVNDSHAGRLTVEYLLEKYLGNEKDWIDVELVQYA